MTTFDRSDADTPLFTASRGFALIDTTPAHVQAEVSGQVPDEESEAMDVGTIFHACLLLGESNVRLVDFPDWRTKVARDTRDSIRASGKTPLLAHKWAAVEAMLKATRQRLEQLPDPRPLVGGEAERSLYFMVGGVACRATPDWVSGDHRRIVDVKTTAVSAHPAAFGKSVWSNGNAFQNAVYRLAIKECYGVDAEFAWLVVETFPPYASSMVALDPEAEAFADLQVAEALDRWKECLTRNEWPGYRSQTAYLELPAWVQASWETRKYYESEALR